MNLTGNIFAAKFSHLFTNQNKNLQKTERLLHLSMILLHSAATKFANRIRMQRKYWHNIHFETNQIIIDIKMRCLKMIGKFLGSKFSFVLPSAIVSTETL